MGRPLKISKSQAVISLTDTYAANNNMVVDSTAGLLPNMPFVVATTTGNLVAGTTYWILSVVDGTTLQASTTDLSSNPDRTPHTLTNAGPVTVNTTVASTDTGFNNPAGAANSYGVVGGNTAQYGQQIECNVAIGIAGTGIIVTDSGNAIIFGAGTDFANTAAAGAAIQAGGVDLGFVASNVANTIAITDTVATGNFVVTSGNALLSLVEDKPAVFSDSIGGIVAGEVYWISNIANATHFTITTAPGFSVLPLADETTASNVTQDTATLTGNAASSFASGTSWVYANDEVGFLVRQKGKTKFLVKGGTTGLTAQCYTANAAAAALTPNTCRIVGTYANASTNLIQSLSDRNSAFFGTGNDPLVAEPVVAALVANVAADSGAGRPYPVVDITSS